MPTQIDVTLECPCRERQRRRQPIYPNTTVPSRRFGRDRTDATGLSCHPSDFTVFFPVRAPSETTETSSRNLNFASRNLQHNGPRHQSAASFVFAYREKQYLPPHQQPHYRDGVLFLTCRPCTAALLFPALHRQMRHVSDGYLSVV